jgi:hypothetical protein
MTGNFKLINNYHNSNNILFPCRLRHETRTFYAYKISFILHNFVLRRFFRASRVTLDFP